MAKPLWMSGSSKQGVSFVSGEKFAGGGVLQSFFTLKTDMQREENGLFSFGGHLRVCRGWQHVSTKTWV